MSSGPKWPKTAQKLLFIVQGSHSGLFGFMKLLNVQAKIRWLIVLLSSVTIIALGLIYVVLPSTSGRLYSLLFSLIPNLIAALVAIPVVYFLFTSKGIELEHRISVEEVEVAVKRAVQPQFPQPIVQFFNSFRDVPWKEILPDAHTAIDIVVNYWDSWAANHHEALIAFFRRRNNKLRLFVPNPKDERLVQELVRLYPGHEAAGIRDKIMRTGDNVYQALIDSGGSENQFEFYYVPHFLNYAAQVIDGNTLILSTYDMFRQNRIGAPAIIIDLGKSEHVSNYWSGELKGLIKVSQKVSPVLEVQKKALFQSNSERLSA